MDVVYGYLLGGVRERLNRLVSKTMRGESLTRVRISPPPPGFTESMYFSIASPQFKRGRKADRLLVAKNAKGGSA